MNRFVIALLAIVTNVVVAFPNEFLEAGDNSRIVFGHTAERGEFPFQAHLKIQNGDKYFQCGGILICRDYVLTAAHCTINQTGVTITMGTVDLNRSDRWTVVRSASEVTNHPNYNQTSKANDIAIIKLNQTINTNDYIKTIYLSETETGVDVPVIAVGWGRTSKNGTSSTTLRYANLTTISNDDCKQYYFEYLVGADKLCGLPVNIQNTCSGDSGGAIVKNGRFYYHLVGNVVGGNCDYDPSVYGRINYFIPWIKSIISASCKVHLELTSLVEKQHSHSGGV